jgi:hypothetical protein
MRIILNKNIVKQAWSQFRQLIVFLAGDQHFCVMSHGYPLNVMTDKKYRHNSLQQNTWPAATFAMKNSGECVNNDFVACAFGNTWNNQLMSFNQRNSCLFNQRHSCLLKVGQLIN